MLMMIVQWRKHTRYKEKYRTLVVTRKGIGLEVNADKTKYMLMSPDQNAEKNHKIDIDDKSFEGVEQFK
jgi:hypothetical protein